MQQLTKNKRGLESDKKLLDTITDHPGLSQYELTRKLKWNSGHVDGSIRRLFNENLITIKRLERNGRTVHLIYPKDDKPSDLIEVLKKYLNFEYNQWRDCAYVYALDTTTIGIAGRDIPEWREYAAFTEVIPIRTEEEKILLYLPKKFSTFYQVNRKLKVASLSDNVLIVTVSGDLIEEKKYPA